MYKVITIIPAIEFIRECWELGWGAGSCYPINICAVWEDLAYKYEWLKPCYLSDSPFNRYTYKNSSDEIEKYKDELSFNIELEYLIKGKIVYSKNLDGEE